MLEDEAGELFGGIVLACFEPVGGDVEFACEFAQRFQTRLASVGLDIADVGVGDAFVCEIALAETECEAAFAYPVAHGLSA
jgi:hypothetical protein